MPVTNVLAIVCGICIQRDKLREAEMEKVGISYGAGAFVSDCVCLRASSLV